MIILWRRWKKSLFLICSFNSVENNDTKSYVAVKLTYVLIKVLATSHMWLLTYKKTSNPLYRKYRDIYRISPFSQKVSGYHILPISCSPTTSPLSTFWQRVMWIVPMQYLIKLFPERPRFSWSFNNKRPKRIGLICWINGRHMSSN